MDTRWTRPMSKNKPTVLFVFNGLPVVDYVKWPLCVHCLSFYINDLAHFDHPFTTTTS